MRFLAVFLVVVILKPSNCTTDRSSSISMKFSKPCFDGDEIENTCSERSDSCHEESGTESKLVRLDGVKVR